jgi:hypothetical protein
MNWRKLFGLGDMPAPQVILKIVRMRKTKAKKKTTTKRRR